MTDRQAITGFVATALALASLFGLSLFLDGEHRDVLLRESGPVEIASALGYLFCAVFMLRCGGGAYLRRHYPLLIITLCSLVIAKLLDGFERHARNLGVGVDDRIVSHVSAMEEILELGILVFMIITFSVYFRALHTDRRGA